MDDQAMFLLESIDRKLEVLLKIRIKNLVADADTKKQKIKMLYELGMENSEIAEYVGTSDAGVRATLSDLRQEGELNDG